MIALRTPLDRMFKYCQHCPNFTADMSLHQIQMQYASCHLRIQIHLLTEKTIKVLAKEIIEKLKNEYPLSEN